MLARARGDFWSMRDVLRGVRAVQGDRADPYIIQRRPRSILTLPLQTSCTRHKKNRMEITFCI